MKISIFGLGYVGCVGMGCLAHNGHKVIGVDVLKIKIDLINEGKPTIVEKDIDRIINDQFRLGNISATLDYKEAVLNSDVSLICVGTPSTGSGHLDLSLVYQTAAQIGKALSEKDGFHVIAIRSTVLPGTNQMVGDIIAQYSGKKRNIDFGVVSNPEFLREGTAVADYFNPPLTVLGGDDPRSLKIMEDIYKGVNGPTEIVNTNVAEIIKYVNNSFHALKIVFANEVGNICKKMAIDSHEVMRIFSIDKQLNISPYYFKPGFAYGGSCLPKDLKALNRLAQDLYVEAPLLSSIEKSNDLQKIVACDLIEKTGKSKIGILGLSFKAGTDDMRQSPIIEVIERLKGRGFEIMVFDQNVILSRLIGKNESYVKKKLPHINLMLTENLSDILEWAEVLVFTNSDKDYVNIIPKKQQVIIDLARIDTLIRETNYEGICW